MERAKKEGLNLDKNGAGGLEEKEKFSCIKTMKKEKGKSLSKGNRPW